jgi:diguanylate cyclase (GGDEF)-like protein
MSASSRAASTHLGRNVSLRVRFCAFAITVCMTIIAVFIADAVHERNVATEVARRAADDVAQSLAQQASDALDGASGALDTVAASVAEQGTGQASRLRLKDTMSGLVAALPRMTFLAIFDERGRLVVSNLAVNGSRLPMVANRPYFAYHRSHRDADVHVSGPARGKLDGNWMLFVSRRLAHADGSFAGVALAPIALSSFARSYKRVDVGRYGSIALFETDGTLLVRKPSLWRGVPRRAAASSELASNPRILFASRGAGRYPLMVRVGLAQRDYLADWIANTQSKAVEVAVIITLIGILAAALTTQIGERQRAEDGLARLALLDALTGIANRRQFDDVLERELRYAERNASPLALLMIDVDHFKAYNDLNGHQRGDDALVRITAAIAADAKRPGDLAARYGGEEFAVILRATNVSNALVVAERIRTGIVSLGIPHAAAPGGVASVSIGLAVLTPSSDGTGTTLLEAADKALYDAKNLGRNRTAVSMLATAHHLVE